MSNVLRVEHVSLASPVLFSDDEVVDLDVDHAQEVIEQRSQSNNLSAVYVGDPRLEFAFVFNIFYQRTLEKLATIYAIQAEFTCYPFFLEEPLTSYGVIWSGDTPLQERWYRGRRRAQWDINLLWKETRLVECIVEGS